MNVDQNSRELLQERIVENCSKAVIISEPGVWIPSLAQGTCIVRRMKSPVKDTEDAFTIRRRTTGKIRSVGYLKDYRGL